MMRKEETLSELKMKRPDPAPNGKFKQAETDMNKWRVRE